MRFSILPVWPLVRLSSFIGLLLLALTQPAAAHEPPWQTFTTADGLPNNTIRALAQDIDGTLWVGTDKGLRHFFGDHFPEDREMPPEVAGVIVEDNVAGPSIHDLLAAPDGSLWVASSSGLFRRESDGRWVTDLVSQAGLEDVIGTHALLRDRDGDIWVGSASCGLVRWDGQAWKTILIADLPPCVSALAEDSNGQLWVADAGQLHVLARDQVVKTVAQDDGLPERAYLHDLQSGTEGKMWLATSNGLVQLSDMSVTQVYGLEDGLRSAEIFTLLSGGESGLWVGSAFGLAHQVDGAVGKIFTSADGLADDKIRSLLADDEGNLWVGTEAGLTLAPLGRWQVETASPLAQATINEVFLDQGGNAYVGTNDGLVIRLTGQEWQTVSDRSSAQRVFALAKDWQSNVWVGSEAGLKRLKDGYLVVDDRVPSDTTVEELLVDSRGDLWVGTHDGLYLLEMDKVTTWGKEDEALGQDRVLSLWESNAGDIWVGTRNGGASRLGQDGWQILNRQHTGGGLADDIVWDGLEDSQGNMWFATSRGLSRLDADVDPLMPDSWTTFREPQVANSLVNTLWEDSHQPGHIWAGTDGGLNLIVNDQVTAFTREDGLSHKIVKSLAQTDSGQLWIGTALGLTYHQDAGQPPQIEVGQLKVDNELCESSCQTEGISHKARTAAFNFQGSDLGDVDGMLYRYVLQEMGEDEKIITRSEWISDRFLNIALAPGTIYRFTAQAADKHFNISSPTETIILPVNAPNPWERLREQPWFLPALVITVLVIVAAVIFFDRQLRRTGRYPYHDLRVAVIEQDGQTLFDLESRRIAWLPAYGPFRWIYGLLWPIERLQQHERLPGSPVPIDKELINVARKTWLQCRQTPEGPLVRSTGELLYQAIFSNQELRESVEHRLGLGRQGVRLRLQLGHRPTLTDLPWELLHDVDSKGFIARQSSTALVRFVEPPPEWQRPVLNEVLRVLVVMAQPSEEDVEELDLKKHKDALKGALGTLANIEVDYLFGVHAADIVGQEPVNEDLPDMLERKMVQGWDVIHFVGHAGKDRLATSEAQAEVVLWCEDRRGNYLTLTSDDLAAMFERLQTEGKVPKLMLLSACDTASMDSRLTRVILDNGVGAVIGMQWRVREKAMQNFASHFYRTLSRHGQVDYAVSVARNAMASDDRRAGGRLPDWAAPVLLTQASDGQILSRT